LTRPACASRSSSRSNTASTGWCPSARPASRRRSTSRARARHRPHRRDARGRVPVIAGTGGNATSEALELHAFAKRAGATACLSVNPYYNKPTQEGLYRHFMTLADKVDLPIVLYNIPGRTGITMSAQTVARLNAHPNIVAMKEATGSLDMASEIMSLCDMAVISGDDSMTLPLMSIGGTGVISVASNLLPGQIKQMTEARRRRQLRRGAGDHHSCSR
jgi:4-hydroxy-tetrahydrodipicolinate synthase